MTQAVAAKNEAAPLPGGKNVLVELDLNINDLEALLRHAQEFQPASGDAREDRRLRDALDTLVHALKESVSDGEPEAGCL